MSRLDRALKRRDKEASQLPVHESGVEPSQSPPSDDPQIPAGLLDRFPHEPDGPDAVRQPPGAGATDSEGLVETPPVRGLELPATTGVFRDFNATIGGKVVGGADMDRRSAEQYRRLAAALHQVQVERGIKKVMVASAVAGEGKTLTALNLALTLSESYRRRVVLIDADLRCPRVHELLDIRNITGLSEALKETHRTTLPLTTVSPRLSVLPAGHADPDPMGQLTSGRMASILEELSAKFDWVVVDTPPVVLLPDTNLLAGMVDVAVLVVRAGRTSCDLVDRAIQALGRKRILGIILNRVDGKESQYPSSAYPR
jgi:protein-tyrosine kinase